MRKYLIPVLLLGIGAANAQPTTDREPRDLRIDRRDLTAIRCGPRLPLLRAPPVNEPPTVDPTVPPLTADSARIVRQRLEAYVDELAGAAPELNTLTAAGLSGENDAVECPSPTPAGMVGPSYVGLLQSRSPTSPEVVDPGLAATSRVVLRAKLGREPTEAELNDDLQAFDQRVANVNQALADMRPRIADAIKRTGRFPRSLEAGVLGVAPTDPEAGSASAAEGFRAFFQNLLTLDASTPGSDGTTPELDDNLDLDDGIRRLPPGVRP